MLDCQLSHAAVDLAVSAHSFHPDSKMAAQLTAMQAAIVHPAPERVTPDLPAKHYEDREKLYAEFTPLVRRLLRQYGQTAEMRQDLEGEIYYRFCTLLEAFDPARGVPLRPYLVRQLTASVYTYARSQWRGDHREISLEASFTEGEASRENDPTSQWNENLFQQQTLMALPHAIAQLPERQRKVVIWRYYEERSFEEIAERLDIQTATARSLLRHGLANLRKHIRLPTD